ncbi:MAG: hypothetical protein AB8G96_15610 [Phycisphaerales bacterium]
MPGPLETFTLWNAALADGAFDAANWLSAGDPAFPSVMRRRALVRRQEVDRLLGHRRTAIAWKTGTPDSRTAIVFAWSRQSRADGGPSARPEFPEDVRLNAFVLRYDEGRWRVVVDDDRRGEPAAPNVAWHRAAATEAADDEVRFRVRRQFLADWPVDGEMPGAQELVAAPIDVDRLDGRATPRAETLDSSSVIEPNPVVRSGAGDRRAAVIIPIPGRVPAAPMQRTDRNGRTNSAVRVDRVDRADRAATSDADARANANVDANARPDSRTTPGIVADARSSPRDPAPAAVAAAEDWTLDTLAPPAATFGPTWRTGQRLVLADIASPGVLDGLTSAERRAARPIIEAFREAGAVAVAEYSWERGDGVVGLVIARVIEFRDVAAAGRWWVTTYAPDGPAAGRVSAIDLPGAGAAGFDDGRVVTIRGRPKRAAIRGTYGLTIQRVGSGPDVDGAFAELMRRVGSMTDTANRSR